MPVSSLMVTVANQEYRRFKSVCTNDLKFSITDNVTSTCPNAVYRRIELSKTRTYDDNTSSTMHIKLEIAYDANTDKKPNTVLIQARASIVKNQDMYKRSEDIILKRNIEAHTLTDIGQAINIILGTVDVDCELGPFV